MELLYSLNNEAANWLWKYHQLIISSWVAVLLVLYGDSINKLLKKIMRPYHYIIRIMSFVILCSVGYGVIAVYGEIAINNLITYPKRSWFVVIVIFIYFLLGFLAERKHQA